MAEEGTEREAQLIPEDEQVALTPDVIRSEVNLLTFPFFALSRKGLREKTKTEYRAVVQRGDRKVEILWRVSSSSEYGYPGPFDQKVHKAIEEIINELPHPVRNPIGFSIYDLCRRMRLGSSGGSDYRKIKEALERIVATTVKSRGTFYAKGRKKWIDDVFHIYDRVVFRGEQLPDGRIAEQNYLYLNSWYLENLNARYVRPLDYDYYKGLRSNIAQRLYELLGVKFYGLLRAGYASIGYRYSTLCQLLPLTRQKYLSKARQILDPAHEELMRTDFLAAVEWSDTEGEGDEERDWLVTYVPGGRAIAEVERYRLSSWAGLEEQEQEEVETLSLPFEVDEGRQAEIEALVEEILRVTGDEENEAFYQRVARLCPTDLIYRVLSEVKDEWRRGLIRTTKGAVFTDKLKRLCRERGIELGLRET
jgi:hypothetical protein